MGGVISEKSVALSDVAFKVGLIIMFVAGMCMLYFSLNSSLPDAKDSASARRRFMMWGAGVAVGGVLWRFMSIGAGSPARV